MDNASDLLSLFGNSRHADVERVIAEFRAARPVVLVSGQDRQIALGVEALDHHQLAFLETFAAGNARLILPAARLRRLGVQGQKPGSIALPHLDSEQLARLTVQTDGVLDARVSPISPLDAAALELAALAMTLPGVLILPAPAMEAGLLSVQADSIMAYRKERSVKLMLVSRAPVPLEYATKTEFVVFRGGEGLRDQVAIVVGSPDFLKPVPVRLHSACLTGDLFGSLKCDCGDQLRSTVRQMAAEEGGILLYLDQEGRGNGLSNKIRAYQLQSLGWDTYDADEALGFDLDQRHFDFAADMLKQLGVFSVKLMTNNPLKIAALRDNGLDVVSDQRIHGRSTQENIRYLASKRDRAGHFIDFESLIAHAPQQD